MNDAKQHLLIIDANEQRAVCYEKILKTKELSEKFSMQTTNSIAEAFNAYLSQPADCILLAEQLEDGHGKEFISELSTQSPNDRPTIIMLSDQEKDSLDPTNMHADVYHTILEQDFNETTLLSILEKAFHLQNMQAQLKNQQAELIDNMRLDELTGLYNRYIFIDLLNKSWAMSERHLLNLGIIYLDINNFKHINEFYDHSIGDEVLKNTSQIIGSILRESDIFSRLGGDEFAIILPHVKDSLACVQVAEKILKSLTKKIKISEHEISVEVSMGLSCFNEDNQVNSEQLMTQAEIALQEAKKNKKHHYNFYSKETHNYLHRQIQLEKILRQNDFEDIYVVYQPIIDLKNKKVLALEALARWKHDQLGTISPQEFITLAEENGTINNLGEYILEKVLKDVKQYQESLSNPDNLPYININISPKQINHNYLELLTKYQHSHTVFKKLIIEITETQLFKTLKLEQQLEQMKKMQALGCQIYLDDFGAGYSSFGRLKDIPISGIKLDKTLVEKINSNPKQQAIVESISQLCRRLKLQLIAEQVETIEELRYLKNICHYAQGFLLAKPLHIYQFDNLSH